MRAFIFTMQKSLLVFLLSLLLAACSGSDHREIQVNNLYSLELPVEMKPVANLHDDASLQQVDEQRPLYVVVIDESKEEMQKHELDYDLDLYFTNIVSQSLVESLPEVSISPAEKKTINGFSALVASVTGKADTTGVFYKIGVIETPSAFYQVLTWTTGTQKQALETEMNDIVESFKELKK
jgi:uncharacterized protein YcfL